MYEKIENQIWNGVIHACFMEIKTRCSQGPNWSHQVCSHQAYTLVQTPHLRVENELIAQIKDDMLMLHCSKINA